MNTSAQILMAALVFLSILMWWDNARILTATLTGLAVFLALDWKGPK